MFGTLVRVEPTTFRSDVRAARDIAREVLATIIGVLGSLVFFQVVLLLSDVRAAGDIAWEVPASVTGVSHTSFRCS